MLCSSLPSSAILAYLSDPSGSTELPEDVLYEIIAPFWHEEPFKSHGFVLEGFPQTPNEAKFLSEAGFYPGEETWPYVSLCDLW